MEKKILIPRGFCYWDTTSFGVLVYEEQEEIAKPTTTLKPQTTSYKYGGIVPKEEQPNLYDHLILDEQ